MLRNATLGCTAGLDRRTSNAQAAVGRNSYDAQLFSCFAQLMLQ